MKTHSDDYRIIYAEGNRLERNAGIILDRKRAKAVKRVYDNIRSFTAGD